MDDILNPSFVGLISAPMPENYVFEDIRVQPDVVRQITEHFISGGDLEYKVLDCRTDTTLSTIMFSDFACPELSMSFLFF